MAKTIQMPERLKDILTSSIITDEGFELPPVERKDYEAIKKATIALGVKWDRKRKLHVWDRPGAKEDFEAWVNGDSVKVTDIKQEWQQFDTPNDLAKRMVDWLNVQKWHFVLEPSAGIGRILDKLPEAGHKVAIEIDPNRVHQIQGMADTVVQGDFMEWSDETYTSFDRIAMNPPFTNKQDIDHVMKAWSLLGSSGKLVAVMSGSITFASDKKTQAFRDLIAQHGWMEELPEDTFKESGTGVRTVLVFLEKGEEPETIEISDSTTLSNDLIDCQHIENTAMELARKYAKATAVMATCFKQIDEQSKILKQAFKEVTPTDRDWHISDFEIYRSFNTGRYNQRDEEIFKDMKKRGWRILIDALGVKQIMSVKKREEFNRQLEDGDLPEITEETITGILRSLVDQAQEFATEASKEVFEMLRPAGKWNGGQYKTNDAFRIGKKVILTSIVERFYGWRVRYYSAQKITAIDGVFHLLDGKGVLKEYPGPLAKAIEASDATGGRGETDYFKFKCCKNGNLHLEFKNLELVKELNMQAVGERVLGKGK